MEEEEQWVYHEDEDEEEEEIGAALVGRKSRNQNNTNPSIANDSSESSVSLSESGNGFEVESNTKEDTQKVVEERNGKEEETDEETQSNKNGNVVDVERDNGGRELEETSVYFGKETGDESSSVFSGIKFDSVECSIPETNPGYDASEITVNTLEAQNGQDSEYLDDKIYDDFIFPSSEVSRGIQIFDPKSLSKGQVEHDNSLKKENESEITEFDVEKVFEKQNTHDMYCPNCNSCITRRVILRKRKRRVQDIHLGLKRDRPEPLIYPEVEPIPADVTNDQNINVADESLDGNSANATNENNQDVVLNSFDADNGKMATKQGNEQQQEMNIGVLDSSQTLNNTLTPQSAQPITIQEPALPVQPLGILAVGSNGTMPSKEGEKDNVASSIQGPLQLEAVETDLGKKQGVTMIPDDTQLPHGNDHPLPPFAENAAVKVEEPSQDTTFNFQLDGLEALVPSTEFSTSEKPQNGVHVEPVLVMENVTAGSHVHSLQPTELPVPQKPKAKGVQVQKDSLSSSDQNVSVTYQKVPVGLSVTEIITSEDDKGHKELPVPQKPEAKGGQVQKDSLSASDQNVSVTYQKVPAGLSVTEIITSEDDKGNKGKDVVLIIDTSRGTSQRAEDSATPEIGNVPTAETQIHMDEHAEAKEVQGFDILKSIVYGGLLESITSIGIVLSSAGADASTLNIIALGLANLLAGLLLIGHNLKELKNDQTRTTSNEQDGQVDKYQETLGRRENFILHAVVVVLSFIIFGLVPLVTYGLLFRKSDNDKDYKLLAVFGAAFVCIIVLAVGKAHIQKPPKTYIKTVMYHAALAVSASGVSYIVGELIQELLNKLGWFTSSTSMNMPYLREKLYKFSILKNCCHLSFFLGHFCFLQNETTALDCKHKFVIEEFKIASEEKIKLG
ncbi:hypothetical protein RJ641_000837 [Dillenia turbinata]|uniref:Membrane protein of ER body-like protein n=1 Tax=Dillenia turbinata TaxID=194707 RepID=A0AAN8W731_9MAGN